MAGKRKQPDEETENKKIKSEKSEDRTVETVATVEPVEDSPTKKMRIISFNVAGLYAATKKNFCENMIKLNPDIICIQGYS